MNELVLTILKMREKSDMKTRSKLSVALSHPRNIQLTIGKDVPLETLVILSNKQSRF